MSAHDIRFFILFLTVFESAFFLQGATAQTQTASSTAQTATRTSKHADTTETLFLGPFAERSNGFAGSVIAAQPCMTTYRLDCTMGNENGYCRPWPVSLRQTREVCQSADEFAKIQMTYGPSTWVFSSQTFEPGDQSSTFIQACYLDGTTKAVCSMTYSLDTSGSKTASSTTTTLSGHQVVFGPVVITSGARKLSDSNRASCTSTSSAAAATAITKIYKLMIVPGAMALLGGL